jgi:hypothetical protein
MLMKEAVMKSGFVKSGPQGDFPAAENLKLEPPASMVITTRSSVA